MNISSLLFGNPDEIRDIRPYWIALVVLVVALCLLTGQAGAGYTYTFQNATEVSEWSYDGNAGGGAYWGGVYVDTVYFADTNHLALRTPGSGWAYSFAKHAISYPTNYWAFTFTGREDFTSGATLYFRLYDSEGVTIGTYSLATDPSAGGYNKRIEIIREGTTLNEYDNGALVKELGTVSTVPYYFGIGYRYYYWDILYFDDIVVGTAEERNVVSCQPGSWFIAKDLFDPGFSGQYSAVDTQINASFMHNRYANDDGSSTIVIAGVQNGNIVNTTTVNTYTGVVTYNLTTMLFNSGAPYGQYRVYMSDITGTSEDYFWYKAIATSGTSVQWDDTEYEEDEEATMTFSISESNWIPDDYSYEIRVLDSNLDDVYSKSIAARPLNATDSIMIDTTRFPLSGTYYATLYATDLSSNEEILLVYDDAYMYLAGSGDVTVSGKTYFALNGTVAGGAGVNITQLGVTHDTTSNVTDGGYEVTDLITDWSIGCNASYSGHESYEVFFTPLAGGEYNVDLVLVPTGGPQLGAWYDVTGGQMTADSSSATATSYWNATLNGTSVGGIIYEAPYWNPASGALVNLSNSTWSDTYLVGAGGWYQFDNLTQSQYTLSISKDGFATCSGTVTPLENQFTRKDAYLEIEYILTVNVKSLMTLGFITSETCTVSLSTGQTGTTSNGTVVFSGLSYNVYNIIGSCEGYYPGYTTIVLDEDMTVDVFLTEEGKLSGPGSNYPPHAVRFTYVDAYGNPITGATVTANAQESTNPWTWLSSAFGFNTNLTDIQNTNLNGTTGHDGTLSFLMVETVQYRVHCVKASAGIDHTVDIYPKNTEYFIRIGSLPMVGSYPTYSLNATTSGGNVILFGNYTDTSGSSSGVRFIVRNSTGSEVYNTSVTLTGGVGSAYYSVNNTKGTQLTFGITSEHTTQGHIEKWIDITLKGSTGRLVDFGSGWTDFMYLAMSLAGIFLVAGCFGEIDVKLGAIFIPITGGIFTFIGWMGEVYGPLITIAGVLGALYYMRSKAKELDT